MNGYTLADARRLWMTWWMRRPETLEHLRAKQHAEGQREFNRLVSEAGKRERDQLRSDEAVERVAKSMYHHTMARDYPGAPWVPAWESGDNSRGRPIWLAQARAAIAALLGEDE